MAQLREIKRRIKSVHETQKITRAMKMVAAAKLRRAQERMMAMRPYVARLRGIIGEIALDIFGDEHPLFIPRTTVKTLGSLVIAGDKGLCGGFNSNLARFAQQHFDAHAGAGHKVWTVGKRATSAMRKQSRPIIHHYHDVFDSLSYTLAGDLGGQFVKEYMRGGVDSVAMVYNEFITVVSQKLTARTLLPIDFGEIRAAREQTLADERERGARRDLFEVEPDPHVALELLVSRLIATQIYHALLESYAAELGARMSAMDNATNNASDMIGTLTMDYNRARQTAITGELLDIVGGAAGLEG